MISVRDFDQLPSMTPELWAEFFGVQLHRVPISAIDRINLIKRFFELVEEESA